MNLTVEERAKKREAATRAQQARARNQATAAHEEHQAEIPQASQGTPLARPASAIAMGPSPRREGATTVTQPSSSAAETALAAVRSVQRAVWSELLGLTLCTRSRMHQASPRLLPPLHPI